MIFVLMGILFVALVGVYIFDHFCDTEAQFVVAPFACFLLLICVGVSIWLGARYSGRVIIDDKIELYRTENEKIEQQMSALVSEYMKHEADTFGSLKGDDAVTLVNLYPELKSNELVAKQLEIYVSNNNTIKKLECDKLKMKVYAYWLFFGKE